MTDRDIAVQVGGPSAGTGDRSWDDYTTAILPPSGPALQHPRRAGRRRWASLPQALLALRGGGV